VQNNKQK